MSCSIRDPSPRDFSIMTLFRDINCCFFTNLCWLILNTKFSWGFTYKKQVNLKSWRMVGACSILEATQLIKQGRTIAWEALKSYEFYLRFELRVACTVICSWQFHLEIVWINQDLFVMSVDVWKMCDSFSKRGNHWCLNQHNIMYQYFGN